VSAIDKKYAELGGEKSFLGRPVSEERWCKDRVGRHRAYERGHIFWHPHTGAHEVHGAIMDMYRSWGWDSSVLGYPLSDEMDTPDYGRYNRFQRGLIVWTPQLGAHGICEDGINISKFVDFRRLGDTHYGNLTEFYEKVRILHNIDLIRNLNTNTNEKKYVGWQVADFWNGDYSLNGYRLSTGERLIITVAQILLMQWHLRDLENHKHARHSTIDSYFNKGACFKRNWSGGRRAWSYNAWCSEFVSYVYRRAGISVSRGKKQHFWCKGKWKYEKLGWCMSNVPYFVYYFKERKRYRTIEQYRDNRIGPRLGNYLCRWNGKGPTDPKLDGHSMLVVGFEEDISSFMNSKIYIINGNSGEGAPERCNKRVRFEYKTFEPKSKLTGVGGKSVSLPTADGRFTVAK
jgi:hypothetical protein